MFKINSKEYKAKEIDFNSVIEMKDLGGDIYEMGRNPAPKEPVVISVPI